MRVVKILWQNGLAYMNSQPQIESSSFLVRLSTFQEIFVLQVWYLYRYEMIQIIYDSVF
jgi:hypothetical protein